MSEQQTMMFPPYLDQGSRGQAVLHLQVLLCMLGYKIVQLNGLQEGETTEAIRKLQGYLGFKDDDVDGNFGPGTRAKLSYKLGIKVDDVPMPQDGGCTMWYGPDHDGAKEWNSSPSPNFTGDKS